MDEARKNRDFSKGPVWDSKKLRWCVEVRYPDGSRLRKRFRREREALRRWSAEESKIKNGTWDQRAPKRITLGTAFEDYRAYSKVQNRSHETYVETALSVWEEHLGSQTPLAKITTTQIENVKLQRARKSPEARSTRTWPY